MGKRGEFFALNSREKDNYIQKQGNMSKINLQLCICVPNWFNKNGDFYNRKHFRIESYLFHKIAFQFE
jgi:hypothetical protein